MKTISSRFVLLMFCILCFCTGEAQKPEADTMPSRQRKQRKAQIENQQISDVSAKDSNTPLHLLSPDYNFNYGVSDVASIKQTAQKVLLFLDAVTPAKVVNSDNNKEISDYQHISRYSCLKKGDFRLTSYEWGVTYSGMLRMAQATGDDRYAAYVTSRFNFLGEIAPYFQKQLQEVGIIDPLMTQVLKLHALDDAGAICAAMIKASLVHKNLNVSSLINNYIDYIQYHEYRLKDGIFARNRPQRNTVYGHSCPGMDGQIFGRYELL